MQLAEIGHQPVQFLIGQRFQRRTKTRAPKVADKFVLIPTAYLKIFTLT